MIKAVFFDFFGVVSSDEYWNFIGEGKQESGEFHRLADEVNLGKISWEKFVQDLSELSGKTTDEINDMYSRHTINREVVGIAKELKEKYVVGLLTNAHHQYLNPILVETRLTNVFNPIIISSKVGVVKPDKRMFEIAAKEVGTKPDEILLIDDIQVNVDGAKRAGVDAFLFRSYENMFSELRDRNLLNA